VSKEATMSATLLPQAAATTRAAERPFLAALFDHVPQPTRRRCARCATVVKVWLPRHGSVVTCYYGHNDPALTVFDTAYNRPAGWGWRLLQRLRGDGPRVHRG
jgi:hypothetical protein